MITPSHPGPQAAFSSRLPGDKITRKEEGPMSTTEFLKAWHEAIESRSLEAIAALVAEDAEIASARFDRSIWTPKSKLSKSVR